MDSPERIAQSAHSQWKMGVLEESSCEEKKIEKNVQKIIPVSGGELVRRKENLKNVQKIIPVSE